ncbi:MAG: DUF2071 domain-containing protein [Planctomycetes bacterium]|nr:DUF2071 domain-containing protein [Planctomycetota bacterium]
MDDSNTGPIPANTAATTASEPTRFLSAEWRWLAMFNFPVEPRLLEPHLPAGTTLDFHEGITYVSLVGFMFLRTRVLGIPVPFHRNFPEVNLRFYVRRETGGEVRRAVSFIKEIVPKWAIAHVARWWYNEPYVALPMWHRRNAGGTPLAPTVPSPPAPQEQQVEYGWNEKANHYRISLHTRGAATPLEPGSLNQFIAEHYWGYCPQRDGGTVEYRVTHPSWTAWSDCRGELEGDFHTLYGGTFGEILCAPPASILLADGSPVSVSKPARIGLRGTGNGEWGRG